MKQCDKRWAELKFDELPQYCDPFGVDFFTLGWRKCLEEMLKRFEISEINNNILNWIKKELGG